MANPSGEESMRISQRRGTTRIVFFVAALLMSLSTTTNRVEARRLETSIPRVTRNLTVTANKSGSHLIRVDRTLRISHRPFGQSPSVRLPNGSVSAQCAYPQGEKRMLLDRSAAQATARAFSRNAGPS